MKPLHYQSKQHSTTRTGNGSGAAIISFWRSEELKASYHDERLDSHTGPTSVDSTLQKLYRYKGNCSPANRQEFARG